jgi:hypothetical protein
MNPVVFFQPFFDHLYIWFAAVKQHAFGTNGANRGLALATPAAFDATTLLPIRAPFLPVYGALTVRAADNIVFLDAFAISASIVA